MHHSNQGHTGREGKVDDFEKLLFPLQNVEPPLDSGMMQEFAYIDVCIMQENISVLVGVLDGPEEIVLNVLIGMASVNEGDVDLRQLKVLVGWKELITP